MDRDMLKTGARHVDEAREIGRELVEKSLHMRCLAYLSQVKARLLTETIFEVDSTKKNIQEINNTLVAHQVVISEQKERLQEQMAELTRTKEQLEETTRTLEKKNQELEKFNKLFVDREFRIKELRDRVRELEGRDDHEND